MNNDRLYMMAGADADQLVKAIAPDENGLGDAREGEEPFDPIEALKAAGVQGLPEPIELTDKLLEECHDCPEETTVTESIFNSGNITVSGTLTGLDPYAEERARQAGGDKAMRFNAGKARYDLLPPEGIEELVSIYTMGAAKYADRNWEKGLSVMSCFASMLRHAFKWASGETLDQESGKHHMGHVAWNAVAIVVMWRRGKEDDRPTQDGATPPLPQ